MKTRGMIFVLWAVLLLMASPAGAVKKDCFTVGTTDWKLCGDGSKQGLVMTLSNICVETMQVKVCLEKEGGEWDCKWFENVPSEESVSMESCDNTGNYKLSACEDKADCEE